MSAAHVDEPYEPYDEDFGDYVECWQCGGEGYSHHDCGEDTCCCLNPYDNVKCDICEGKGGWPRDCGHGQVVQNGCASCERKIGHELSEGDTSTSGESHG